MIDGSRIPEGWHDLYIMLGTSAALIGLLFVASTLHVREIASVEMFKVRVQNTMLVLVGTLLQATAILTPQPLWLLGVELLVLNLWGFWFPLSLLVKAARMSAVERGGFSFNRGAFFSSGYVVGIAGAIALIGRGLGYVSGDDFLCDRARRRHLERLDDDTWHRDKTQH